MPRATPLAQDETRSARSILPIGDRPTLVLIRCNARAPRTPHHRRSTSATATSMMPQLVGSPAQRQGTAPGGAGAPALARSEALQQFAVAAERRRASMDRFTAVAGRMASQAALLAETLRRLQFAGSAS